MGKVLIKGSGGGTIYSSDLTAEKHNVLYGTSYVGADTDDDIGIGTMVDRSKRSDTGDGETVGINSQHSNIPTWTGVNIQDGVDTDGTKRINICPPTGYYPGNGAAYVNMPSSSFGDAQPENVLNQKTFSAVSGFYKYGTMPNNSGWQASGNVAAGDFSVRIPKGYHDGSHYVNVSVGIPREGAYTNAVSCARGGNIMYIRIPQGIYNNKTSANYPEIKCNIADLVSNIGMGSATNVKLSGTSWAYIRFDPATSGAWTGYRVAIKRGGYPSNPDDGSILADSSKNVIDKYVGEGTWYVKGWNYFIDNNGTRYYGSSNELGTVSYSYSCGDCGDHCCESGNCSCDDDCSDCNNCGDCNTGCSQSCGPGD